MVLVVLLLSIPAFMLVMIGLNVYYNYQKMNLWNEGDWKPAPIISVESASKRNEVVLNIEIEDHIHRYRINSREYQSLLNPRQVMYQGDPESDVIVFDFENPHKQLFWGVVVWIAFLICLLFFIGFIVFSNKKEK